MANSTDEMDLQSSGLADLKPQFRRDLLISRQRQRDQDWVIVRDPVSSRQFRFSSFAFRFCDALNGVDSIADIAERLAGEPAGGMTAAEINHVYHLLASNSLLTPRHGISGQTPTPPRRWLNPLSIRVPLINPTSLLDWLVPLVRRINPWFAALLWLVVCGSGGVLLVEHHSMLTSNLAERALAPDNLLVMLGLYPLLKLLHELGHALATRLQGGIVTDAGVLLVALLPLPYVDCSSASLFAQRRQRVLVGAAGVMVELFIASIALWVWASVGPGLLRGLAFNTILIAGISTLLVNGNPLLRYDAYYVLSDLIGIQNLGPRANRYWRYLAERFVLGLAAESPAVAAGERRWFLCYGFIAAIYRWTVVLGLLWYISDRYFFIGIVLAIWAGALYLVMPIVSLFRFLHSSPRVAPRRTHAVAVLAGVVAVIALFAGVMPLPLTTLVQGVATVPENAEVRAGTDMEIVQLLVENGGRVSPGQVIAQAADPGLDAQLKAQTARVRGLEADLLAALSDPIARQDAQQRLDSAAAELADLQRRRQALTITAEAEGRLIIAGEIAAEGRYLAQGEVLAYILGPSRPHYRVVVPQGRADLVRHQARSIMVRTASRPSLAARAVLDREVPAADARLPSAALGHLAGGNILVDPTDPEGTQALESLFVFELSTDAADAPPLIGERVSVRFSHGAEPLIRQVWRSLRALWLSRHLS
ncbi:MAG: hypothetical protein H6978_04985 [Gammaproteobacteria bacterium]|nr:hypothetical protein [Gammaproteobacteria bacterium]